MGKYPLSIAGLWIVLGAGCAAPNRQDLEYRLSKAEGERDQLQTDLDDERAKVVILQERLAVEEQGGEVARAEVNLYRDRARQLEQARDELVGLLEKQVGQPLEPPEVGASPLPVEVDGMLQSLVERHPGRVWYDRGRGAVSLASDRLFAPGSDEVDAAAQGVLGELAGIAVVLPADEFEVIVAGHTDDTPITTSAALAQHASNWHLSVHRAIAVKNVLVSAGLPDSRMGVMGYGAYRPLGEDRARNRRVEVFFVRKGEVKPLAPVRLVPPRQR